MCVLSCRLFATPWIVAHQAPLSMGFSRQGYQSELPLPSPGDLPDAGIPHAPPALAGGLFTTEPPGKLFYHNLRKNKLEGFSLGFPVAQTVKCLPAVWETWVQSLGWENPLEKEMATHSSTLAWKIPWTEEPSRLRSMGSQRVEHN